MHREVQCVTVHEVSRSRTQLSTELNLYILNLGSWANIDIPIKDDILKGQRFPSRSQGQWPDQMLAMANTKNSNIQILKFIIKGLPWQLSGEESACNIGISGDINSIPGSGRSPGEGNGNLLQYFCLENPVDRGACWATVHRVEKSRTLWKRLSMHLNKVMMYLNLFSCSSMCDHIGYFPYFPAINGKMQGIHTVKNYAAVKTR